MTEESPREDGVALRGAECADHGADVELEGLRLEAAVRLRWLGSAANDPAHPSPEDVDVGGWEWTLSQFRAVEADGPLRCGSGISAEVGRDS